MHNQLTFHRNGYPHWIVLMATIGFLSCTDIFAQRDIAANAVTGKWYTEGCQAMFEFCRDGDSYKARMFPLEGARNAMSGLMPPSVSTRKASGTVMSAIRPRHPLRARYIPPY
jgi:hypothetical protein